MLLFARVPAPNPDLTALAERGLPAADTEGVRLWTSLDALPDGEGPVLVVDPHVLSVSVRIDSARSVRVPAVSPEALCNLDPYRPPEPVIAGGGYVGCPLPNDVALLVIFRRGVWDLPKGTKAPTESVSTCARREVSEEVGVNDLTAICSLGTTQHGYPDGHRYAVKTTYWYLMRTPERSFEPDRREGICRVEWARWDGARRHMGYDTLRRHMNRVEEDVRAALAG